MPSMTAPSTTGAITPKRSAKRPINTPPAAKPNIVRVNGSEAAPRSTANCTWAAGSVTTTDHMPTPPSVLTSTAAAKRNQA